MQTSYSQLANFQSLDFCVADDQSANRYESDRDCAQRDGAYCDCTNRLRAHGEGTKCNGTELSSYFPDFV